MHRGILRGKSRGGFAACSLVAIARRQEPTRGLPGDKRRALLNGRLIGVECSVNFVISNMCGTKKDIADSRPLDARLSR